MSDAHNDPPERAERRSSEFERIAEERRRYTDAKREARRLRRLDELGDPTLDGEHPWLRASRIAKGEGEESEDGQRSVDTPPAALRLWLAGIAFLLCISVAIYGAIRVIDGQGTAPGVKPPRPLHVWHSVEGPELAHLMQLAAAFSPEANGIVVSYQPEVERAVRQSFFQDNSPDVVILSMGEARSLAALGILEPVIETAEGDVLYLPLVEATPWSQPLVAVILRHRGDPHDLEKRRGFVRFLREHLSHAARPSTPLAL